MKEKIQAFIFGKKTKKDESNNTNATLLDKAGVAAAETAGNVSKVNEADKTNKVAKKSSEIQNPYIKGAEGRAEWNDRYMNMSKSIKNWQIACGAIVALAFVQLLVIVKLATESKIQPYVVETNQGIPYNIKPVTGVSDKDQLLINYAINQFVINAKTIIADTTAEKAFLDNVYAYSAGSTMGYLQDFYAKQNPFELAGTYTVSVNIINSLALGDNTWQVIWEETKHDVNSGTAIGTTKWVGHFTYQFGEVNPKTMTRNPFGIYVTSLSWSQSQ